MPSGMLNELHFYFYEYIKVLYIFILHIYNTDKADVLTFLYYYYFVVVEIVVIINNIIIITVVVVFVVRAAFVSAFFFSESAFAFRCVVVVFLLFVDCELWNEQQQQEMNKKPAVILSHGPFHFKLKQNKSKTKRDKTNCN